MARIGVRGEWYEIDEDPLHWPVAETMIVEQTQRMSVLELADIGGVGFLTAMAFIGVRTLRPRLSWADHIAGLTLADIDFEPSPDPEPEPETDPKDDAPSAIDDSSETSTIAT